MLTASLDCGGAETHIARLSEALAERGHSVTVVSEGGRIADGLSDKGIGHIKLPLNSRAPWSLARAGFELRRMVRKERFDVIHAHSRIAAWLAHDIAVKEGIAFVTTAHAMFRSNAFFRRLSRWGSLCIAVGEDIKQYISEEYGVCSDNITVIPNGIDTEKFSLKSKSAKTDGEFSIVFVSRMDRDCSSGAYLLCLIAERLWRNIDGLRIILCGGGEEYGNIARLASSVNERLGEKVIRAEGRVDDVAKILGSADAFVGVSRAALEAMAVGVPVVLCGDEGFGGLLSEEGFLLARVGNFCCREWGEADGDKLFGELMKVYNMSADERQKLGRAIRELVVRLNGRNTAAVQTEAVYKEAINRIPNSESGVLLCGFYGYGNVGDDCLLTEAVKRSKAEHRDMAISALTKNGKKDSERFGVRCVPRKNPFAAAREIKKARIFVFGGGTLLQDSTSRRSLIYYTSLLRYAARNGARCELWSNGLGEPRGRAQARRMAKALSVCSSVGLRDSRSLEIAREISVYSPSAGLNISYERDMALSLSLSATDSPRTEYVLRRYSKVTELPQGFAVIALHGGAPRGITKSFIKALFRLSAAGVGLLFVPMFPAEDSRKTDKIAKCFGGEVAYGLSGKDICSVMSKCRCVYAMRLHALIFAFCAGVPFVGYGADSKIESFCRENGGVFYADKE